MTRAIACALLLLLSLVPAVCTADEENSAKEALQAFNDYVGSWKGAGSNNAKTQNWNENFAWSWRFKGDDAWLMVEFKLGKEFTYGELRYLADKKKYQLTATDKKDGKLVFEGELKKGYLTLDRVDAKSGDTQRLMMNVAGGGVRFVYSMQRKAKGTTVFTKLYQVDFSKEGE